MDDVASAIAADVTAIVTLNGALDRELLVLSKRITPATLHQSQGEGRWALAQQLGHLGEFPPFFADDLQNWLRHRPGTPVGRTHDHPARLRAVEAARGKSLGELLSALEPGFSLRASIASPRLGSLFQPSVRNWHLRIRPPSGCRAAERNPE